MIFFLLFFANQPNIRVSLSDESRTLSNTKGTDEKADLSMKSLTNFTDTL